MGEGTEQELQNLIRRQADRIEKLESHIESINALFGQKERTFAMELHQMRFLISEFVKHNLAVSAPSTSLSLDSGTFQEESRYKSCSLLSESSEEQVNDYGLISMAEEEFRCTGTQTDPISSSEHDDDDGTGDLELAMDHVGEANPVDFPLEYEEVTLNRHKKGRRLGLTLCYGNTDEYDTDIFVSEIEKGSVAEHDGRIRVGDQILEVNHQPVNSRKEVIAQFSMDGDTISILCARPRLPENDDSNDEDEEIANVTDDDLQQLSHSQRISSTNNATLSPLPENDDGDVEKDSGLSRATDSDPDVVGFSIPPPPPTQPPERLAAHNGNGVDKALEHELAFLRKEMETIRLECDRLLNKHNCAEKRVAEQVQQATSLMQTIDRLTDPQSPYRQLLNNNSSGTLPATGHFATSRPMNGATFSPRLGLERRQFAKVHGSPVPGVAMGVNGRTRTLPQEETSSAYNTGGDSCRSTPMKGEYAHVIDIPATAPPRHRPLHLTTTERVFDLPLSPNSEHPYHTIETPVSNATTVQFRPHGAVFPEHPPLPTSSVPRRERGKPEKRDKVAYKPGDIMYTSPENLAETIALQQRLLRQTIMEQQTQPRPSSSRQHVSANNTLGRDLPARDPAQKYEWKVKRRSDGTCYITRRPLRNQVLKAREDQLNKERHGLSTDDDAASELKIGRFWSREERKRHLEQAKEKKANKMQIAMQRAANPPEQMIMQLSNRKQMRRSGRQLFDKFTTLQEFLAHGSRDPSAAPIGGILSVTTV